VTLDPRAIALQGLGFSALLIALEGLSPVVDVVPPPAPGPISAGNRVGPPMRHFIHPTRREDDDEVLVLVAMALQLLELP
jgi:hypothetical protein